MQISDLNIKALTNPAWVAFDDTNRDTYRADFNQIIDDAVAEAFSSADVSGGVVDYTSGDAASPTAWTAVTTLTSGLSLATLFNRVSTMIKNVRYLWTLLGSNSFSNVATTITGAIGNTALTTTAQTLSGAIAEHESDISALNSNIDTLDGDLDTFIAKFTRSTAMLPVSAYQSRVDGIAGGYMRIGNLVFVSIIARTTTAISNAGAIITGFPKPYSVNLPLVGVEHTGYTNFAAFLNSNGNLCIGALSSGIYFTIGGVYICAD